MNDLSRTRFSAIAVLAALLPVAALPAESRGAEIVEVRKIWDQAPHNAFTDLLRHGGRWLCVFREGAKHGVSPDGSIRVITSDDGTNWSSLALISSSIADLRDPKITVTPAGKLMLCAGGALNQPSDDLHQSFVWHSDDGKNWSDAIPIGDRNFWIWRITWHKDKAYGVGYQTKSKEKSIRLYSSADGRKFDVLLPDMGVQAYPNETSTMLFQPDGTCLCLLRCDGNPNDALLGSSPAPYAQWTWRSLGLRVGGPEMVALPDSRIIAAGRGYPDKARTQIWQLDPQMAALKELATLPSGGDNSYPGLEFHDGLLWVSYYSTHEDKTSIYLARVKL